ncbi:hypothetical protein [Hamadaea tsunoensis]|uniref:hypothetical protein n=1 Tax=Hamadaea tsunoensis TaxID=53368 RepID=UPI0004140641|nr:hypothetical protein [Hamadaea tsunoensis]
MSAYEPAGPPPESTDPFEHFLAGRSASGQPGPEQPPADGNPSAPTAPPGASSWGPPPPVPPGPGPSAYGQAASQGAAQAYPQAAGQQYPYGTGPAYPQGAQPGRPAAPQQPVHPQQTSHQHSGYQQVQQPPAYPPQPQSYGPPASAQPQHYGQPQGYAQPQGHVQPGAYAQPAQPSAYAAPGQPGAYARPGQPPAGQPLVGQPIPGFPHPGQPVPGQPVPQAVPPGTSWPPSAAPAAVGPQALSTMSGPPMPPAPQPATAQPPGPVQPWTPASGQVVAAPRPAAMPQPWGQQRNPRPRWFRRNLWGLLFLIPALVAAGISPTIDMWDQIKGQPLVEVTPGADQWATYAGVHVRLESMSEEKTLPGYGGSTVPVPAGVRAIKVVLAFDGPSTALNGCQLYVVSKSGEKYASNPNELDDGKLTYDMCSVPEPDLFATPAPTGPSPSPGLVLRWKTTTYFALPLSAYAAGVRIELRSENPRYLVLS